MKNKLLLLFFINKIICFAQAPTVQWLSTYPSTSYGNCLLNEVQLTTDSGYITVGEFDNNFCIIKYDANGNLVWNTSLGGSLDDTAKSIQKTSDGGYLILGHTNSQNDGNVWNNHGGVDFWLIKLNSNGVMQWNKCLGGLDYDFGISIKQLSDGNYILSGEVLSSTGTLSGYGGYDYYVYKISSSGDVIWQNIYGGNGDDYLTDIAQTSDGGFILSGSTLSFSGLVTGNHGGIDGWIVKINSTGVLEWQKCIGGTGNEDIKSIKQTADGNYILAGNSNSTDGDLNGNYGQKDYWILKMSSTGSVIWSNHFGGSLDDYANCVEQTSDGNFIIVGNSKSVDGDIANNIGAGDIWLLKLNNLGQIIWGKTYGSTNPDFGKSIKQTTDNGYIICGNQYDASNTRNIGVVYKLNPESLSNEIFENENINIYPNPTSDFIEISFKNDISEDLTIVIYDAMGKICKTEVFNTNYSKIDLKDLSNGIYFVKFKIDNEIITKKFVKI